MDLSLGSAWIPGLHCKDKIQRLVLSKSEITRFRALKTVRERSVRSVLLLNVGVPTRSHTILGTLQRGLVLSIGWAGRQLEKNVYSDFSGPTMQVGLEAGTGVVPGDFPPM